MKKLITVNVECTLLESTKKEPVGHRMNVAVKVTADMRNKKAVEMVKVFEDRSDKIHEQVGKIIIAKLFNTELE